MAAALPFLTSEAALLSTHETTLFTDEAIRQRLLKARSEAPPQSKELLQITGVFRGRELTRKERRLTCGITSVDRLIGGGIVRGRISEIIGSPSTGKTSLAAAFAASITARGEVAAWIDAGGGFDPASIAAAGVDLARILWIAMPANRIRFGSRTVDEVEPNRTGMSQSAGHFDDLVDYQPSHLPSYSATGRRRAQCPISMIILKAAEWILTAGGFGLVVIDCGGLPDDFNGRLNAFTQSAALRLAHGAERSGAAVLMIAPHRMCGTFAALSLMLSRHRACFSRTSSGAPMLFDGLTVEAQVARNKLGGSGGAATWRALVEPASVACPESALPLHSSHPSVPETAESTGQRAAL